MRKYALTTLLIVQCTLEQSLCFETNSSKQICGKEEHESSICCTGYYIQDGICKKCFGAIGPNCSIPCESNFFGYLCKNQCDCQKDEICNRYFGCNEMDSSAECHNTMLLLVIGFGSTMLSLALLFVGVLFYRWHTILQSNLHPINIPRGFQVDFLPFSGNHEVFQENYDDIRESRMLLADKGNCHRETIENRLSSTDYSHLYLKGRTSRKSISEMPEQYYSTIDARFKSKMPLVTMSEFPEDECYVSVSQLARQNKRISKSCSDLKIDMSDTYHDIYSNQWCKASGDTNNRIILIEHL
ncbi:uncharacterized protein LOC128169752 [Crassostrea angulata]|uniref:uncharacterized protein LOC128169752 n=1 Tax=Magallana angulata TaxID=2784310 RepID=UPI0022B12CC7|nr:uncharacterized protein LOC128169752 [Crassostrea angulata]